MMPTLKKLLFSRRRSSLNLFLILPILVLVSVGCLCAGKNEPLTCLTADGSNLIWAGASLQIIRLADGAVTHSEEKRYADVLCLADNEIITVKEEAPPNNNKTRAVRNARWHDAAKTYRLADIEAFQKYLGVIQNRYFVSRSRGFVERSRKVGKNTERYNLYNQPQVFNLEDTSNGQLKSHYLYRDKLGLPETTLYEDLGFYPLSVDENGSLFFAMSNRSSRQTVTLHKINLFDGTVAPTGVAVSMPQNMSDLENVVSDRGGKFIAFVYEGPDDTRNQKLINVLSTATNQTVVSKNIREISFNTGTPRLIFEENGAKLAMMVEGFKFDPTRSVHDITVFDLETGSEISYIDAENLFKDPETVGLIGFVGDDLLLTYGHKKGPISGEENHLCKVNLRTKQIVWDKNMSGK